MVLPSTSNQTIRVALEPVYNILNSFSLLSETSKLSGLNTWLIQTATTLTPEQHHTNRLLFEGLRDALLPEQDEPDFPTYLQHFAGQNPEVMRNRFLERLSSRFALCVSDENTYAGPDVARLLSDVQAYLTCVEYVVVDAPFDPVLQTEVHTLLQDATALHHMIVTHLETLWQLFAPEWKRVQATLRWQVEMFTYGLDEKTTVEEAFLTCTGRNLPSDIAARLIEEGETILVPSWHIGRQVTLWQSDTATRLFFSEPPNYDVAVMRSAPIGKPELRARLAALADDTRLRIIELLMQQDEMLAQDIINALELSQSSVSRHLKQLVSMKYLYERRGEGANKTYRLSAFYFERTARAIEQLVAETSTLTTEALDEKQPQELRRFLDRSGKITLWPPAKQRDKLLILEYLASFFEQGRVYSEKEVNALLLLHSTFKDAAALRRALYEYRFMSRTPDGSQYWLIGSEIPEHLMS